MLSVVAGLDHLAVPAGQPGLDFRLSGVGLGANSGFQCAPVQPVIALLKITQYISWKRSISLKYHKPLHWAIFWC